MLIILQIVGASDKIVKLLDHKPAINTTGGIKLNEVQATGRIEIKDLHFNYPSKKDIEIIKGVNIDIEQNKVVALVGPSGKALYFNY